MRPGPDKRDYPERLRRADVDSALRPLMLESAAEIERLRAALNNSQSLLVATLLENRPEAEVEAQVSENRDALGTADA